jgi:hypothetical protein
MDRKGNAAVSDEGPHPHKLQKAINFIRFSGIPENTNTIGIKVYRPVAACSHKRFRRSVNRNLHRLVGVIGE